MARARPSRDARRDLREINRFLTRAAGRRVAERFARALAAAYERLAEQPFRGGLAECDTQEPPTLRVWPVRGFPNHLIFYRPEPGGVFIVRLMNAAQDWQSEFGGESS